MLISFYNHTIAVCFSLKLFHLRGPDKTSVQNIYFLELKKRKAWTEAFRVYFSVVLFLSSFFPIIKKAFILQMNHQARCKFLSNCIFKGFCLIYCQKFTFLSISERKIWIFSSWVKCLHLTVAVFLQGSHCTCEKLNINGES